MNIPTATPREIDTKLAEIFAHFYAMDARARKARTASVRADLSSQALAILNEAAPYEAEYAARPWSRFFLVTSSDGHIHRSRACSTCRVTTQFGWLPELSGKTEADAVEAHGGLLCTVCFPSAPSSYTDRHLPAGQVDTRCAGSGTSNYVRDHTDRMRFYSGRGATCAVCNTYVSAGSRSTNNLRKHNAPTA